MLLEVAAWWVVESRELQQRALDSETRAALATIRLEFEEGEDVTQRLTRRFYRAGFNDFVFNAFGIQHIHLGASGAGQDATKRHVMSGGGPELLFVLVGQEEVCFLDVLGHEVFDSPQLTKSLLQIALANCRELVEPFVIPGAFAASFGFEEAFQMTKGGFSPLFEVDGVVFANSNILDGKVTRKPKQSDIPAATAEPSEDIFRAACTSSQVVDAANRILNRIADLVRFVQRQGNSLVEPEELSMLVPPIHLSLEVVQAGEVVILREQGGLLSFRNDGIECCRLP